VVFIAGAIDLIVEAEAAAYREELCACAAEARASYAPATLVNAATIFAFAGPRYGVVFSFFNVPAVSR